MFLHRKCLKMPVMNRYFSLRQTFLLGIIALIFALNSCQPNVVSQKDEPIPSAVNPDTSPVQTWHYAHIVGRNIRIKDYFRYMDSLVSAYDSLVDYDLTHHLIVRANPWIIDTFENTDYYRQRKKGVFVYDQQKLEVLKKGDTLFIPTDTIAKQIEQKQDKTVLDINIPEYTLRIIEDGDTIGSYLVRVGQNRIRQWSVYEKMSNLRTRTGSGKIVTVYFKTFFLDPVSGKNYYKTARDDGDTTLMPLMPWIEPEINGECNGQLIHPTTNETTLGKAYSNGCIGTAEGDMWRIYFYAPMGTKVRIRYNLNVKDANGESKRLKDIYGKKPKVG